MPLPPRSNRTRGSLASQAVAGSSAKYSGFCVSTTSWPIAGWASKARAGRLIIGSPATGTSGLTGTPAAVASGSAIGRAPASRIAVMVAGWEDVMPAR